MSEVSFEGGGAFRVQPRPNIRAVSPGPGKAVLLHAEELVKAVDCPNRCGGVSLVWEGWDLRGRFPWFKAAAPLTVRRDDGGDDPFNETLRLSYTMVLESDGKSRGRIAVEADFHGVRNADLDDLCIAVRITVPWKPFDAAYVIAVAPHLTGGKLRRRWRVKPYQGLAVVSAMVVRGAVVLPTDWPASH